MIITRDGDILRNLEEQVAENKRLIIAHYDIDRVLADLGITVVGDALQSPPDNLGIVGTKWGEAYPVGYQPPYDYYVWTRPTPNEENINNGEWFNIGPLAIPGPRGFAGPQGLTGPRGESTQWYTGDNPNQVASPREGDLFLDSTSGDVYQYSNGAWSATANIRGNRGATGATGPEGPQGIQGEQGPQGEPGLPGAAVRIMGILNDVDQLPEPADQEPGTAYLIKDSSDNYIIWVALPDDNYWEQAGPIQASVVTVGGSVVDTFNADTKVDKITTTGNDRLYGVTGAGVQTTFTIDLDSADQYTIVQRTSTGEIVCNTGTQDNRAATKKYVDDGLAAKLNARTETSTYPQIYEKSSSGNNQLRYLVSTWQDDPSLFTTSEFKYSAVQRDEVGRIQIGEPTKGVDAVNKSYADTNYNKKLYKHTCTYSGYAYYDGAQWDLQCTFEFYSSDSTSLGTNFAIAYPTAILNKMCGTSAATGTFIAHGTMYNASAGENQVAYITITRSTDTMTVFNEYNEVIAVMNFESNAINDIVSVVG